MKITHEWLEHQVYDVGSGGEIRLMCPNCDDTGRHLYVNRQTYLYYCFKCGQGGKVVHKGSIEPNLEQYNKEVVRKNKEIILENKVNPEMTIKIPVKSLPFNVTLPHIEIPEDCANSEELNARQYLYSRGVTQDEILRYDIRLSTERNGPHKNSIIFPIYNDFPSTEPKYRGSTLEYFVCRRYNKTEPKYINAPWAKHDTLFVANSIPLNPNHIAVIVEGVFDALAIARVGFMGIALLGKKATAQQLNRLIKSNRRYLIYLDSDALVHAIQLKMQLNSMGIKTVLLRSDQDAADLYLHNGLSYNGKALRRLIDNAINT